MIASVAKEFTFHAAHVLPNHDGPCSRRHGHSYRLRVTVEGWVKQADGSPDEGMVLDFEVIKTVYQERVEPKVEHQDLNETLVDTGELRVTTCEALCLWIAQEFRHGLERGEKGYALRRVRLYETPTSYAEIRL